MSSFLRHKANVLSYNRLKLYRQQELVQKRKEQIELIKNLSKNNELNTDKVVSQKFNEIIITQHTKNEIPEQNDDILNEKDQETIVPSVPSFIINESNISANSHKVRFSDSELVIYLYIVCYNEEFILPHLLKHYHFVKKIFIYDNGSTDNSLDIIKNDSRCEIINYSSKFNDEINKNIKNNCWKQHRLECDYCIVCDADEFIYLQ